MIVYCPRCRVPLNVRPTDPQGKQYLTCPTCLQLIVIGKDPPVVPAPLRPRESETPMRVASADDRLLNYRGRDFEDEFEGELRRDSQFVIWGILVFGGTGVAAYLILRIAARVNGGLNWLDACMCGWMGAVTLAVGATLYRRSTALKCRAHANREVDRKSTARRGATLAALAVGGILAAGLPVLALVIVVFIACGGLP